jgi:hypothetical protein
MCSSGVGPMPCVNRLDLRDPSALLDSSKWIGSVSQRVERTGASILAVQI